MREALEEKSKKLAERTEGAAKYDDFNTRALIIIVIIIIIDHHNNYSKEKIERWQSRPLHGQLLCQTEKIRDGRSWNWIKKGDLKKKTEGLIMAAQDPALRTNVMEAKVEKKDVPLLCRMCGKRTKKSPNL